MSKEINGSRKPTKIKGLENLKNVDKSIFPSMPADSKERKEGEKEKPAVFKFPEKAKHDYLEWMEKDSKKNKRDEKEYLAVDKLENTVNENLKSLPATLNKVVSSMNYALDYIRSEAGGPGSKKLEKLLLRHLESLNGCIEIELQEALKEHKHNQILPEPKIVNGAPAINEAKEKSKGENETEKRIAISKFLWKKIESAIKEKFGAEAYFKRFITDEIIDRFVKELGGLFYVNEEGFVKSKNSSKKGVNEFGMKTEKFAQDYLKNISESIKTRKENKKSVSETEKPVSEKSKFKTKMEFVSEFGLGNLKKKYEDGEGSSFYYSEYSAETGQITIRVWYAGMNYSGEKKQDKIKIDLEKFREIMDEMKKPNGTEGKRTLKGMLGFRERKVVKPATATHLDAEEIAEKEMQKIKEGDKKRAKIREERRQKVLDDFAGVFGAEEFMEEEKEILEIYLEDAKEMVSFINNLDYEGEYGYRKEKVAVLREAELERFWDKFEQRILEEGEFAGEKLKKAMEYWKKMSVKK